MHKVKKIGLWAIVGLFLSWLLSCYPASPPSNQPEIEFWTMQLQPKFTQYFNQLIDRFEADNPEIKVRWVDVPWEAMESKVLTAVSAKTAPDVINLNPNFASQLATRNAWLDLKDKVPAATQQQYLPKIWQANTIDICQDSNCKSTTFGIPWYLTTQVTFYNQDLLTKASIEKPPATYGELARLAAKIKEKTGKYAFFATFAPGDSAEVLESLVQMGVELLDQQGKAAFNTPAGIRAFQYWTDLYQKQLLPPEVLTQGHRHGIELYQAGETAFLSSGVEYLETIANNAPSIAEVSVVVPQITGITEKKNVAVMNLVIPRDTKQPDAAIKFALFVTNSANQLAFAKAANVLPSTQEAVENYIQELAQEKNSTPLEKARQVSAMQLKDTEILVPARKNLNQLQKIMYENLQAAMLKQKTVEQAIIDAAAAWNSII